VATDVIMPALGMAQETGKVLRWLKAEGEEVAKGEPLMEVETDKVTVEIEAPAAGHLAGVRAPEGAEVPVGETVAVIVASGEEVPANGSGEAAPAAVAPAPVAPAEETYSAPGERPRRPNSSAISAMQSK
jgi:pyruvate dehydrogenase E2 component (dihydrolipoamide acetyltransferase)